MMTEMTHRVALDTFQQGCIARTITAIIAARALEQCTSDTTRTAVARIAEDEAAYAALAWQTLARALAADTAGDLRTELRARAAELHPTLADDEVVRSAWVKVIVPTLADLL